VLRRDAHQWRDETDAGDVPVGDNRMTIVAIILVVFAFVMLFAG
jgi:hypothetical protein